MAREKPGPKPLTEKQRLIYLMLENEQGETFASVGQRLGLNRATVREHYLTACKKKGHDPSPRFKKDGSRVEIDFGKFKNKEVNRRLARSSVSKMEEREQAAAMMAATNPTLQSVKRAAEEAGISPAVMKHFMGLLAEELGPAHSTIKEARIDNVKRLFGSTVERILGAVTDEDIEKASLKDKMVAAGIAAEKWLLMRGQPTQILSIEERVKLDEIAPALLKEVERRGIELIKDPVTGTFGPNRTNVKSFQLMDQLRDQES